MCLKFVITFPTCTFATLWNSLFYLEMVFSINVLLFRTVLLMLFYSKEKNCLSTKTPSSLYDIPRGEELEGLARIEIPANPNEALVYPLGFFPSPADCRWGWALGKDRLRMKSCLDAFVLILECLWQHHHHEAPRWAGWRDRQGTIPTDELKLHIV